MGDIPPVQETGGEVVVPGGLLPAPHRHVGGAGPGLAGDDGLPPGQGGREADGAGPVGVADPATLTRRGQ